MVNENLSSDFPGARWRRGLAPDTKMVVAIGALLGLILVSVLVALVLILGVSDHSTRLVDQKVRYATAIADVTLHAKTIANDERGYLISGRKEFLDQRVRRTAEARTAFAVALNQATSDAERTAVERARGGFEAWIAVLEVELARFQAGDREGAVAMSLSRTRPLRKTYEASLTAADELAAAGIQTARSSVTETTSRSLTILLVYLVVALVIGFGIAFWIVADARFSGAPLRR